VGSLSCSPDVAFVIWPDITVGAFVILFVVYAFTTASGDAVRAFSSAKAGPAVGYLILSLLSVAAGVAAWSGPGLPHWC
jgi:hypothetical protein